MDIPTIQRFDTVFRQLTLDKENIPVIIFCDPGVDDALMLLQMLNQKKFPIAGIIPVRGNASSQVCLENTLALCEYVGRTDVKIYPGKPEKFKGFRVYGKRALNGLNLPKPKIIKPESIPGITFAYEFIKKNKTIIISTAGLTEPYEVLDKLSKNFPGALQNVLGISIMGGIINASQEANFPVKGKRYTEANVADNPSATQKLFTITQKHHVPIFLSTLDLTHSVLVSKSDIRELKNDKRRFAQCTYKLISSVPRHYQRRFGKGPDGHFRQPIHDVHASCCLLYPEMYYGQWMKSNVFLLFIHFYERTRFIKSII